MADYGSLVCKDCVERLRLGKILWVPDTGKAHASGFLSGLAGGRGYNHNWQDDDLNYSLFAMLAKHSGHEMVAVTDDELSEAFPGRVPVISDVPDSKFPHSALSESRTPVRLVTRDGANAFPLGSPLLHNHRVVQFSAYYDQLDDHELSPRIWGFLARWLSSPLVVEMG
jgi:hypothetical protein